MPFSTTYRLSPSSPCLMTFWPASKQTFCIAPRTTWSSYGFRAENMKAYSRRFLSASNCSSLFGKNGALKSSFLFQLPKASALTEVLGFLTTVFCTTGSSSTSSSEESLPLDDSDSSPVERSSVFDFIYSMRRGTSFLRNSSSARSF